MFATMLLVLAYLSGLCMGIVVGSNPKVYAHLNRNRDNK